MISEAGPQSLRLSRIRPAQPAVLLNAPLVLAKAYLPSKELSHVSSA